MSTSVGQPAGLPVIDFIDAEFRRDPFARFGELFQEPGSVAIDSTGSSHVLFRFDDVSAALRDPRIGVSDFRSPFGNDDSPVFEFLRSQLLAYDPPGHSRLRRLMSKAFTPRRVETLRAHVTELVDELLGPAVEQRALELVSELSFPMPVIVICEMLGVDPGDRERFTGWSADLAAAFDPIFDPAVLARADEAVLSLRAYLGELIERRRVERTDGVLTDLIAAEEEGDRLSHEELVCNTLLLLFAGHETTKNLIANGMYALLTHPAELQRLRADRSMLPNAVEEMLRFDPPVGLVGRQVLEEIEFGTTTLPAGTNLAISIMAANRDPLANDRPDVFDITRADIRHISFGIGAHYCLGASLARLEAHVAFNALLDRYRRIELDTEAVPRQESFVLRGVDALPLIVTPA